MPQVHPQTENRIDLTLAGGAYISISYPYPVKMGTVCHLERVVALLRVEAELAEMQEEERADDEHSTDD